MPAKCHKWNFEIEGDNVLVCKGDHEKETSCQYEKLTPSQIIELIHELRSKIFVLELDILRLTKD